MQPRFVDDDGFMRLPPVSEREAGKYTCLVDISVDGRKYTAARSIQMTISNGMYCSSLEPEVSPDCFSDGEIFIVIINLNPFI